MASGHGAWNRESGGDEDAREKPSDPENTSNTCFTSSRTPRGGWRAEGPQAGLRPPSLGEGRSGGHQHLAEWEVREGHEGRAPQGTKLRLKAEETQKLEKMCSQHRELVIFTGGRVRLTLLGVSWDSAIHSPALHKPVGRGQIPSSPLPLGWRILLGEGQVGFRECPGLQGPSQAALSYRWLLLFSIFLEFSPSPTSLSCWLSLLLLKNREEMQLVRTMIPGLL